MRSLPPAVCALVLIFVPAVRAGAQQLDCQPCNHGFGEVHVGNSKQYLIRLTNQGSRALKIRSTSVTGSAFSVGNFPLPVTLRAGASTQMPVIFAPTAGGRTTGTITVNSNALNPHLTINVWGTGIPAGAARLVVQPSSLDFGDVTVGTSASLPATLSAADGSVTISADQFTNSEFSLPRFNLPLTLAVGQSAQVTVEFTPNVSGTSRGKLVLYSDAINSPKREPLSGNGVPGGSHYTYLSWDQSNGAAGYNVYRGGKHGGPYGQINLALDGSTNYTDNGVDAGTTYYYVVTAVDPEGRESGYSNEVKIIIPKS